MRTASADGYTEIAERPGWEPPARLADADRNAAAALLAYHNESLEPGDPLAVAGRIAVLLVHPWPGPPWDRGLDEPTREGVAWDWTHRLSRYPLWAVHQAAEEWLEYNRYRPTLADMRLLCDRAIQADRVAVNVLRRVLPE